MIEQNDIFDEVKDNLAMWCETDCVGADLAAAAGSAITHRLHAVSVLPGVIGQLWPWLENTDIKIITRFMVDKAINDEFMSDLASRINTAFHDGADGAIVLVRKSALEHLVTELSYVRDDLFFNKTLSVGLDIVDVDASDWENVFLLLQSIRADSLTLFLSHDDGDKSDFVGRVYAMLNSQMGDWHGAIHFMLGKNFARIDQVYRLTQLLRADMTPKMLFWINN